MDILFGIIAIGIGALLLFSGYYLARILLPLWGFFAGFTIGAAGASDAFNTAFIGTTMGIVVGLIVGLVFALCAYFFYSLAVVLLGASLGYWVGTGLLSLIGIDKGFISALVGITLGIVFAVATIGFNAAKYLLIALTSFAGGLAIIKGLLLVFGKIERSALDYTSASQTIENSTFWIIALVSLVIVGIIAQISTTKNRNLDSWTTAYGAPKQSGSSYNNKES